MIFLCPDSIRPMLELLKQSPVSKGETYFYLREIYNSQIELQFH